MIYKFLCTDGLGIAARQNELIEMALTFGFRGIEIDMADMVGRADAMGTQFATQFVNSADVEIASFRLPIDLKAADEEFEQQFAGLERVCELAGIVEARQCYLDVAPTHPALQYMENFEKHVARIGRIAERLEQANIRLGLQFRAAKGPNDELQFVHKPEELVALAKTTNHSNVGIVLDTWNWQLGGGTLDSVKELDLDTVFEVRLADIPVGATPADVDSAQRLEPGSNPETIAQATLDWLKEKEFTGPVAVTAHVPQTSGNAGELPFQRIGKALDQMIAGTHGIVEEEPAEEDGAVSEDPAVEVGSSS